MSPSSNPSPSPRASSPSEVPDDTPSDPSNLLLDENFDGGRLDSSVWNTCHWWDDEGCTISSNDELEWYRSDQVSVSNGVLHLVAERQATRGTDGKDYDYRSGMVTTGMKSDSEGEAKLAFTYGKVEARLRVPAGRGLWPAMWMLPASGMSRPEIDILEVIGQEPDVSKMHLHPADRSLESAGRDYRLPGQANLAEGWHTIGVDWTRNKLTWLVDGKAVWQITGSTVPSEPMYLVFNLAVGGVYPGPPDAETKFPASFDIDYVRVTKAS